LTRIGHGLSPVGELRLAERSGALEEEHDGIPVDEPEEPSGFESAAGGFEPDSDEPDDACEPPRSLPSRSPEPAPLMSGLAQATAANAFHRLSTTVLNSNPRTLEDLVTEMLRPMLTTWLDENLPPLVERLVRAEIERVARGGR
jgi:cell pole-organizing protein PopZ